MYREKRLCLQGAQSSSEIRLRQLRIFLFSLTVRMYFHKLWPHVCLLLLLDLPGKLYKHCYNCYLFGPASSRFSPTFEGLQSLKFIFSRKTTKTRNTRTHWRLQILSRKKWHDSDWTILTARLSTVEWVLHS